MGRSPGLVVMDYDSCSKGRGFESRRRILDGHFFTLIRCKNCIVCLKRPKINEKEQAPVPCTTSTIFSIFIVEIDTLFAIGFWKNKKLVNRKRQDGIGPYFKNKQDKRIWRYSSTVDIQLNTNRQRKEWRLISIDRHTS